MINLLKKTAGLCFASAMLLTGTANAVEPTLEIDFSKKNTEIEQNGVKIKLNDNFTDDGFMIFGKSGVSFNAAPFLGEKGTVIFKFRMTKPSELKDVNRYLLTLRTKSRLTINIYNIKQGPVMFGFADQGKAMNFFRSKENIVMDKTYYLAFTYDGDMYRCYIDGKLLAETKQNVPVEKISNLNIGPYRDGWMVAKPWGDDCFVGSLKLYNTALTPEEIAASCEVKLTSAQEEFPPVLQVAEKKNENLDYAASLPYLIHGKNPAESDKLPPSKFNLSYDKQNLYLNFQTSFPAGAKIKAGYTRTPESENEVWSDESFESYFLIGKKLYRFAGNAAGGSTEMLDGDAGFNGKWEYKTSTAMKIDNTTLWQGSVIIPWTTLGITNPEKTPILFNFCRTWRLDDLSTHSSLFQGGNYNATEKFARLQLMPDAPAMQFINGKNLESGNYRQTIRFASPVDADCRYEVKMVRADGGAEPAGLLNETFKLKKNEVSEKEFKIDIPFSSYNTLLCRFYSGKNLVAQQLLPYKLNDEFFNVKPHFLQENIEFVFRKSFIEKTCGALNSLSLVLKAPNQQIIANEKLNSETLNIKFPRTSEDGTYSAILENAQKVPVAELKFFYPGIGEYESTKFDNRIIPPYTPLKNECGKNQIKSSMYGRTYLWNDKSILPTSIISQEKELLASTTALLIDGKAAKNIQITPGKNEAHRLEFTVSADNADYQLNGNSFIEYDGVNYNYFTLTPKVNLNKGVVLRLALPGDLGKYIHTSDAGGAWGAKITDSIKNGERKFRFYPSVWFGMEDKGLCFFTETRQNWKSGTADACRLVKNNQETYLEIKIADNLKKGETFKFEFGLLASPVRPLAKNYPLNNFSYSYAAPMNREGKSPVCGISFINTYPSELNSYLADLPTEETSVTYPQLLKMTDFVHKFNSKAVPYHCGMYVSEEYPEVNAFKNDWQVIPEHTLEYIQSNGKKHFLYELCPESAGNAFFISKLKNFLKRVKVDGSYFDFGRVASCNNSLHGCNGKVPYLARREFYRRVALTQLDAGIKEPLIVIHNTDEVQLPAMTFVTHLFNGEHIRQHSSTIMHDGKDILDTYELPMFASELSTMPFGITNTVYQSNDVLMKQFGGDPNEDKELYKFRITKAFLAGTLVHNTMLAENRCHFGIFDKIFRIYQKFDVPNAEFIGYWNQVAQVDGAKDIYVSVYKIPGKAKALAIISHIGKPHLNQTFDVTFDTAKLGFTPEKALDLLPLDDPEYQDLYKNLKKYNVSIDRTPLKIGDFGSKINQVKPGKINMTLNYHSFAIIELE